MRVEQSIWSFVLISVSSVQFSCSVMSNSLQPHELQHARPPCPSPTRGVHPNPCPSSWWCHLIISSSVIPYSSCPQSFPASRVFSNESALHIRWPKYWSFSFNITPSNEHPGLICFRMDWLDLLVVHGTLKSLLQHRNSKASILQSSAFFIAQLSHPYLTTGKTIALTTWSFVGKLMSLLFNMLSLPLPKTVSHISMSLHKTKWFFSIKGISRVPEYLTVIYLNVYIHGVCLQFSEKKGPTYSCSIISQLWQTIFPRDFCRWAPGKKWGGHSDSKQNR